MLGNAGPRNDMCTLPRCAPDCRELHAIAVLRHPDHLAAGVTAGSAAVCLLESVLPLREIVRAPILGKVPAAGSWIVVLLITLLGWALCFFLFQRYRRRIAYWM